MSELVYPSGRVAGCLPRATKFGTCCKPLADEMDIIRRDQWGGLIGTVSLRHKVKQILDQGSNGSCATESTTQSEHIVRAVAGLPFVLLNPLSIYRVTSGGRDQGSSIDENLVFARETGILPESYWPRSKGFRTTPPDGWQDVAADYKIDEFFDVSSIDEVGTALLRGFPVVFGWEGHSCVLVELLSDIEALYANSWGDWGDEGFGTIKLNKINFQYGSFATRTVVPSGETVPTFSG